jgi:hypothetical protein
MLNAVLPQRILDTRTTTGGHKAPVGGRASVSVKVLDVDGVPSTGVAAVVVHVTGVGPTVGTYLQAFGTGNPKRSSSTLNLNKGATVSNNAIVPVGPDGAVSVYNSQGSLNVVIDVQGWIAAPVLTVTPPLASALNAGPLTSADGKQALTILNNANRYAMTTWWNDVYPSLVRAPMHSQILLDDVPALTISATTVNTGDNTRRLCMEAFSLAVSIATGAYNPADSGNVSTATATRRTVTIISKVVAAHLANMPGGWGATTESTFYAAYVGPAIRRHQQHGRQRRAGGLLDRRCRIERARQRQPDQSQPHRAGLQHADLPEHAGHPGVGAGWPARAAGGHCAGRAGVRVLHDD